MVLTDKGTLGPAWVPYPYSAWAFFFSFWAWGGPIDLKKYSALAMKLGMFVARH